MELIFGSACIRNNIFVGKWMGLYTVGDGEGALKWDFMVWILFNKVTLICKFFHRKN